MKLTGSRILHLIAMMGAGQLSALPLLGQNVSNDSTAGMIASNADAVVEMPPSPVELFRQLMVTNREAQEKLLANRAPENRKEILDKVQEDQALNTNRTELELKATPVRWHLRRQ